MHIYTGSMGKTYELCPECDLPEKWSSKFSESKKRRYYVYTDPKNSHKRLVRWSHPTKENPLHQKEEKGQIVHCKRKAHKVEDN